jgi:branched-chain amino acid transport system substrate-binding protein
MPISRRLLLAATAGVASPLAAARAQPGAQKLRIGAITDLSGPYRDTDGASGTICLRQAATEFMAANPGFEIEILSADHQNKPDVGLSIAREWFDRGDVDALAQIGNSAVALACMTLAEEKDKVILDTGAGSSVLTGASCSPNHVHWAYDTWCLAHSTGSALAKSGGDKWYFITADYAFGHTLSADTKKFVAAAGGKTVGEANYPFPGTSDFSAMLLMAQSSGANVLAFANSGADLVSCVKQAQEFGLTRNGMRLAGMICFITDVQGMGLQSAQGLMTTETFYWDLNDRTRSFYQRVKPNLPVNVFPNMVHAASYSAGLHYFKTAKQMGMKQAKASGRATVDAMKRLPTDDDCFGPGLIREDGRKIHPAYLFRVKAPNESRAAGDVFTLVATTPAEQAFRPLSEGGCRLVHL